MEILFVRHAQPAWVVDGVSQPEPALTSVGARQAELLAARLGGWDGGFSELIVSSALRSRQTMDPISATVGLEPEVVDDLVEIKMPDWSDTPAVQVEQAFRDAYRRSPDEWWDGMPGGESFRDFHDRICTAMVDLLGSRGVTPHGGHLEGHLWDVESEPTRIVLVGHGGTNACAIGFLLGLEPTPWEWERFVLGHASVARLKAFPLGGTHIFSMRSFNDQEHLPRELRSR